MNKQEILAKLNSLSDWQAPALKSDIKQGDMPGDKVQIEEGHVQKAKTIFGELTKQLKEVVDKNGGKAVITVCGGSGVGKSEIASLLAYYFESAGIGAYTLSGDNYPHRIPVYNDAERLRLFRKSGIERMLSKKSYTKERFEVLHELQKNDLDADMANIEKYDWYKDYLDGATEGLKSYLGTVNEIDFEKIENIVSDFKSGKDRIFLKRMGRDDTELWYDEVDFSNINILIIEWTHGNSDNYKGVDLPILLNSTPEETLAHRRARNRDGKTDSPFTMRVLEIEQNMLKNQAPKAKIILSKQGNILTFEEFKQLMQ